MSFEKSKEIVRSFNHDFQFKYVKLDLPNMADSEFLNFDEDDFKNYKWNYYWVGSDLPPFGDDDSPELKFQKVFKEEYDELNNRNIFFHCCLLETYKENFKVVLNKFLDRFPDALKVNAIKEEIDKFVEPSENTYLYSLASDEVKLSLNFSRTAILRFLIEEANKENYDVNVFEDFHKNIFSTEIVPFSIEGKIKSNNDDDDLKLQWNGDISNLIELIEALLVNENIKGTKKDVYKYFGDLFNLDLSKHAIIVSKFIHRNTDNETKFLNELASSLLKEIKARLEKKRN